MSTPTSVSLRTDTSAIDATLAVTFPRRCLGADAEVVTGSGGVARSHAGSPEFTYTGDGHGVHSLLMDEGMCGRATVLVGWLTRFNVHPASPCASGFSQRSVAEQSYILQSVASMVEQRPTNAARFLSLAQGGTVGSMSHASDLLQHLWGLLTSETGSVL